MPNGMNAAVSQTAQAESQTYNWQDEVAAHVANQFDLLNLARIAPLPADYRAHGGAWMPSVLVHTRDHLHADGNVRVPHLHPASTSIEHLGRLATKVVEHLIRIDSLQPELSRLVKAVRAQAIAKISQHGNIVFRGVFIDEVSFVPGEFTPYGTDWIDIYVEVRFGVKTSAGLLRSDHATIKVRLGHKPSYELFTRAVERAAKREARAAEELANSTGTQNLYPETVECPHESDATSAGGTMKEKAACAP